MPSPVVSVVIPAYGHAQFLPTTLESVLNQTFEEPVEIIVVNDGSPDDTEAAVAPYRDRIRYFSQENGGQASARNHGLRLAQGEFIALLDDDDTFAPDKLAWQVAALRGDPDAVLVYGEDDRIDAEGKTLPPDNRPNYRRPSGLCHDDFLAGCWIATPGQTLIRRTAIERIGGYDETIWGSDDWELYIRLSGLGPFLYDPRVALHYRLHPGNSSGSVLRHLAGHRKLLEKHPTSDRSIQKARRAGARAFFLHNLLRLSHAARLRGDLETSLKAQHEALSLDRSVVLRLDWLKPYLLNRLGKGPRST